MRVPLILRYPKFFGPSGRVIDTPINTPDIPATIMGALWYHSPGDVRWGETMRHSFWAMMRLPQRRR